MTQGEFTHMLNLLEAYWEYPGEPRPEIPHAINWRGHHTNGVVICSLLLEHTNLCEVMAGQLVMRLRQRDTEPIHWVADAAYSGTDLGAAVARQLNWARHATVEKDNRGYPKVWRQLHVVERGERVLMTNELLTTPEGSAYLAKEAVATQNLVQPVSFVPFVLTLVNRSVDAEALIDGSPLIWLARYKMGVWKRRANCPYCQAGSKAYRPKTGRNWERHFKPYIVTA